VRARLQGSAPYDDRVMSPCRVLLVSGSLRRGSTNTALLRTVQLVAPDGIETVLYDGVDGLPHFDPDRDRAPLHPAVADLRATIRACDAILFCTPEYAGALPGSFKNLLDWTIGDDEPGSIYEKPVSWVNASAAPTGAADAHDSLRKVLNYAHAAVVKDACASIPVTRQMVRDDGIISEPTIHAQIRDVLATLIAHTACFKDATH
jgi:chromate reductase, NAD(P)H dehydrogenase (quinone)